MYSGINGALYNKTKQTPRTFVYIYFFSVVLNFFPWLFALKSVFLSQPIPSSSGYC